MKLVHALVVGEGNKDLIVLHGFLGMGDSGHAKNRQVKAIHLIDQRNHGRIWSPLLAIKKWQRFTELLVNH